MHSTLIQKFFWRFILLFLLLYIFPYGLGWGFTDYFENWTLWHKPITWIGENLFGWEFNYDNLLIGWDSKFEVCRYLFIFFFGTLLSGIWIYLDQRFGANLDYEKKLKIFTQTCLRYHLAIVMLHYGLAKVFAYQFGSMDLNTLETPIGDLSPMSLMWSYLSYSKTVTVFSGWAETIAATLLFFRRTTLLGSVLQVIVLSNVVLWDIGYSVTVTFYAIQLLLLTLVLLSTQLKGLYHYFILNRASKPLEYSALFTSAHVKKWVLPIKAVLLIGLSYLFLTDSLSIREKYMDNPYEWFSSSHKVIGFSINGKAAKDSTSSRNWKKVVFNDVGYFKNSFNVQFQNNKEKRFTYEVDSINKSIRYKEHDKDETPWNLMRYQTSAENDQLFENEFMFYTTLNGDTIKAKTRFKTMEDFLLMKRGKRWIIDLK